jgi:exopolyphosphatase/guanosine-5'-triphosphate,3'-diphosphate pyrophosphatase
VFREATNRDEFLNRIYENTGIGVRLITGDEEALLSGKGVSNALNINAHPFLMFDLGGGSTEFLSRSKDGQLIRSFPLGAVTLTQTYIYSDPPEERGLGRLSRHIDASLKKFQLGPLGTEDPSFVIGTGGTVTTLAAMLHRISLKETNPDSINGLIVKMPKLEALFSEMRNLTLEQRLRLPGLGQGRTDVILAGSLIVIKILQRDR